MPRGEGLRQERAFWQSDQWPPPAGVAGSGVAGGGVVVGAVVVGADPIAYEGFFEAVADTAAACPAFDT